MLQELKARISDLATLQHRLIELGATFTGEVEGIETYFKQPEEFVLKVVEDNTRAYILRLQAQNGGFVILEERTISAETTRSDAAFSAIQQFAQDYGIHRTLHKRRRLYQLGSYTVELNAIAGVGEFIILVGETPSETDMQTILGTAKPDYIRVPFSDL